MWQNKPTSEFICANKVCKVSNIEKVHCYLVEGLIWRWGYSDWLSGLTQGYAQVHFAITSEIVYWCIIPGWIINTGLHANHMQIA